MPTWNTKTNEYEEEEIRYDEGDTEPHRRTERFRVALLNGVTGLTSAVRDVAEAVGALRASRGS